MYIDMKKTLWERVFVPDDQEEVAMTLVKTLTSELLNAKLTNEYVWKWENLVNTDEFISTKENDNQSTIEVYNDGEKNEMILIWDNMKGDIK